MNLTGSAEHQGTHYGARRPPKLAAGFTLVELLVALAVIGILVALLLPAVQAAREAARKAQCRNNLRQMGIAMQSHHDTYRRFPSNGWGHAWVGDPDRGSDRRQPGGWVYNILAYVEQGSVRELGKGQSPADKRDAAGVLMQTPLTVFNCPSRRRSELFPYTGNVSLRNADNPNEAAKTDYAANAGDKRISTGPGPRSYSTQDLRTYRWPDISRITGVIYVLGETRLADVLDGASNTYIVGEKYISFDSRNSGGNGGDDQTMFVGDDADVRRWTEDPPLRDTERVATKDCFGSMHSGVCFFAFCDGSVHGISYGVDRLVHQRLGNRSDGEPVTLP